MGLTRMALGTRGLDRKPDSRTPTAHPESGELSSKAVRLSTWSKGQLKGNHISGAEGSWHLTVPSLHGQLHVRMILSDHVKELVALRCQV